MNTWKKYSEGAWASFGGQYYDLQLTSTREVQHCWPYGGHFTPVDGSGEGFIEGWKINAIRVSAVQ